MVRPKLSIIIPCYNEAAGLPNLVQQLTPAVHKLQREYEIELIFVDDGSTDKTYELLQHYYGQQKSNIILRHERNKNLGAALKTGFAAASGDLIAALDSDCTYSPELLYTMVKMTNNNTDIVTVSPYHPQGKVNNVPAYRVFLSKSVSRIYKILLPSPIYTYTAMVRVYKKGVIKKVQFNSDTFLSVTELMVKSILQGYRVKELPTELKVRQFGASKMKTLSVIGNHIGLIGAIISHKILKTKL